MSKGRNHKHTSWTPHPSSSSVFSRCTLFSKQQPPSLGSGQELLFPLPAAIMEWGERMRRCVIYRSPQCSSCFALQCKCRAGTSRTWSVGFFQFIKEILFFKMIVQCVKGRFPSECHISLSAGLSFFNDFCYICHLLSVVPWPNLLLDAISGLYILDIARSEFQARDHCAKR